MNNAILLWFREHANSVNSVLQAPISVLDYSYIKIEDLPKHSGTVTVPEHQTVDRIINSVIENSQSCFTILCRNSSNSDIFWTLVNSSLVGIANTHRISDDGYTLWEVIFAANLQEPYFINLQISIEISAANLPNKKGVVFTTNSKSRGNLDGLSAPWINGKSGYLSMHVYNWMPPTFITGDILFPYTCI